MAGAGNNVNTTKKRKSQSIVIIGYVILIIVAMIIIGKYALIKAPSFWIASFIEIVFAFIFYRIRPNSQSRIIILLLFALFIPEILASNISVLKPIGISPVVFLAAGLIIQTVSKLIHKPKDITFLNKLYLNLDFNAVFPSNLPLEFEQVYHSIRKIKDQTILEIDLKTYDGIWFFIYQSEKTLTPIEIKRETQKSEKIINGVHVSLAQEIKLKPLFAKKPVIRYVEVKWNYHNINFLLQSNGTSLEDVEKIVTSMIK